MLICIKYSHDGKDIQTIHFNDAVGSVSISPDNLFWTQKTTDSKYKLGEIARNVDDKIPNEPICVYNSENICHHRLIKFFLEVFLRKKITAELKSKSSQRDAGFFLSSIFIYSPKIIYMLRFIYIKFRNLTK